MTLGELKVKIGSTEAVGGKWGILLLEQRLSRDGPLTSLRCAQRQAWNFERSGTPLAH